MHAHTVKTGIFLTLHKKKFKFFGKITLIIIQHQWVMPILLHFTSLLLLQTDKLYSPEEKFSVVFILDYLPILEGKW